jgi:hypothetical protein
MPEHMLCMYVIHLPWRPSGAGLRPVKNQDTGAIAWKDGVLIHKFAALAHIIAYKWLSARFLSGIRPLSRLTECGRGYESIDGSGEVMRRKKQGWLIHSSSRPWRGYGSEVAKL